MDSQKIKEIRDYLSGPRDREEGVALYCKYGYNLRLKRQFAVDESAMASQMLFEELRKLAGMSEAEFSRLPRMAYRKKSAEDDVADVAPVRRKPESYEDSILELADSLGVSVDELMSDDFRGRVAEMDFNEDRISELEDEIDDLKSKYQETPEPVRKMIRFREKYPFLSAPDCPDVLKVLVADMFTAYGKYKAAHARMLTLADDDSLEAAKEAETIVNEFIANREIWEELEYYRENGAILGKAAKFRELQAAKELEELSDVDLLGKYRSAQVNVSKNKSALETARSNGDDTSKAEEAFERWSATKDKLAAEIDRRKKKRSN